MKIIIFLLTSATCFSAIHAGAQWDVRTTGVDTNGGGFDSTVTSPGTNYATQDAAQVSFTDLVIGATTTQLTSAGNPFSSVSPGNIINVTGGTGCTTGRFEILSVSGSTATMDRSVGTAASTCTGNLGGGMLTIQAALNASVSNNIINIKTGTYTLTSTIVQNASSTSMIFSGYGTTWGDWGTAPTITTTTDNTILVNPTWGSGSNYQAYKNLNFTTTASVTAVGISDSTNFGVNTLVYRVSFAGFTTCYKRTNASGAIVVVYQSSFSGCSVAAIDSIAPITMIVENYITGGATGVNLSNTGASVSHTLIGNVIVSNTGSGISATAPVNLLIRNNTIASNGANGIVVSNGWTKQLDLENNVIYGNTLYGISLQNYAPILPAINANNAYGSNGSGDRLGLSAGTNDVTLLSSPFISGTNFGLNSSTLAKQAGYPGIIGGSTGYLDIGAIQSSSGGQFGSIH